MGLVIGYRGHERRFFTRGPNWWQITFPPTRKLPRVSYIRVYRKAGQAPMPPHPLGYRRWDLRKPWKRGLHRFRECWWVLTGRYSLHIAWQRGYEQHIMDESARRARGGQ